MGGRYAESFVTDGQLHPRGPSIVSHLFQYALSFKASSQALQLTRTVNTQRKVMDQSFTFSDGFTLPKGTVFAFPSASLSLDSELVDNPEEFDLYRFVKLAKQNIERDGLESGWAASQAGATNMA